MLQAKAKKFSLRPSSDLQSSSFAGLAFVIGIFADNTSRERQHDLWDLVNRRLSVAELDFLCVLLWASVV